MSMYNLDSDGEDLDVPSHRSPTIIIHDAPLPMHLEEVHSSPITEKVLFEKTYEDPVIVATTSVTLTQATAYNVTILNEKLLETKYENIKLKDEIINLREEMKKRRKVEDRMIPLKENILEQQEQIHDVKLGFFIEI